MRHTQGDEYIYSGQLNEAGQPDGLGSILYITGARKGELYQGTFDEGKLEYEGLAITSDGGHYKGMF